LKGLSNQHPVLHADGFFRPAMKTTCLSPAKVNLFLKVLSKRPDGYHNIYSVVDPVSLYDLIHIEQLDGDRIVVKYDKGVLPEGERNTIYRAAKLIKERYAVRKGVDIYVEKKIPIGSGLGGPSSNAATVLKALAGMWGISVSDSEFNDLGKSIGADVPLFLYGKPCIMEGIGDIITPIELPRLWYLIVYPNVVLSTKEAYGRLKIVLTNIENDIKLMGNFKKIGDIADSLENDLEQIGMAMCPQIKTIKDLLMKTGALGALMSGSGSSIFGVFQSENDVEEASRFVEGAGSIFKAHSHREG
jgi:4-diphosphocytidyl-2-C-methyl-D-erythritol kinase